MMGWMPCLVCGTIGYEKPSAQVKFYDYHVLLYAYSHYPDSEALGYFVGRLDDSVIRMDYNDA